MRSNRSRPNSPLQTLGSRIKIERERLKESIAEVSGAVEIDIDLMQKIENGEHIPSEEILLLLISHFDIEDGAADKDGEVINSPHKKIIIDKPIIVKLGKHRLIKIIPED